MLSRLAACAYPTQGAASGLCLPKARCCIPCCTTAWTAQGRASRLATHLLFLRTGGRTSNGLSPSGSLCPLPGGSPTSTLQAGEGCGAAAALQDASAASAGGGSLFGGNSKLFGDVDIGFEELHTYEQQEAEELAAEVAAEAAAEAAATTPAAAAVQPTHA